MAWNRRLVKAHFPVIRGTFIDEMTKVYLKLVERVARRVTHSWHTQKLYTNENFCNLMETARELRKTKEDAKIQQERLQQFPRQFQRDLKTLYVCEESVFILADSALATTTCGSSRRLIIPRPTTVDGQRREPRDVVPLLAVGPISGCH